MNDNHAVQVIWHDHEILIGYIWEMGGHFTPGFFNDHTNFTQGNPVISDLAEDAHMPVGYDGDEVRAGLGVIIIRQADGTPLRHVPLVIHDKDYKPI